MTETVALTNELLALSTSIAQFREEQERQLLNMTLSKSRKAVTTELFSSTGQYKNDLARMLDVDVIISPVTVQRSGGTKWPNALVANFGEDNADLGLMEGHGSLWRMVKKEGNFEGTRVFLQSSEIGEKNYYLNSQLALVPEASAAAIWAVKLLVPAPSVGLTVSSPNALLVQFELVGDREEPQLLVSATSEHGEKGLAILSQSEREASKASGDLYQWCLSWEVIREDTVVEGMSFLEYDEDGKP